MPGTEVATGSDEGTPRGPQPRAALVEAVFITVAIILLRYCPMPVCIIPMPEDPHANLIANKVVDVLAASALAAALLCLRPVGLRSVGLSTERISLQLRWAVAAIAMWVAAALLVIAANVLIRVARSVPQTNRRELPEVAALVMSMPDITYVLVLFTISAAAEELLFRGLLMTRIREASGSWITAALGSSLLFGVLHITTTAATGMQAFLVSLALAAVFAWSRSLVAVTIGHCVGNLLQVLVLNHLRNVN